MKLAAIPAVVILFLIFLLQPQQKPFGFSVGPSLPPGKVEPQLVKKWDVGILLAPDGSLWCWGDPILPTASQMKEPAVTPQRIYSSADWRRVAGSHTHALAVKTDGSLWGWGFNGSGAAAQAPPRERVTEPTRIGTDTDWTQIAVGAGHCLALKRDGSLWAWGQNEHGQVGDGTTSNQFKATRIGSGHDWRTIAAGDFESFALKADGTLWAWGLAAARGGRDDDLSPRQIDSSGNIAAISANDYILLALRSDGTVWIRGLNAQATASAYFSGPTSALVRIGKDSDWKEAYAGTRFFFARKRNGSWWVCGGCKGTTPAIASPRRLPLNFEPCALAPGFGSALLLTKDGALWTLTIRPDASKFAAGLTKVKALLNQLAGFLPGAPQPFNLKEFRIDPTPQKLWELPGNRHSDG